MADPKANPVDSFDNLRDRVERFVRGHAQSSRSRSQLSLELSAAHAVHPEFATPRNSIGEFLAFMSDALPHGDVYLFGGVLRDLALLGRRGFDSDIDLVVEGDWAHCIPYLRLLGARINKFGGFRLEVGGWPVDIWNAEDTWAIRQGLVRYRGIASLTETTILNWDAILMNWRTRSFIARDGYLPALRDRLLDMVLEPNPNPLGMAVRVFRHLTTKDARSITSAAANYLAKSTLRYRYEEIRSSEIRSYGRSAIDLPLYMFFERLRDIENRDLRARFAAATKSLQDDGLAAPRGQTAWDFDGLLQYR